MAIFNSYVKLPEGNILIKLLLQPPFSIHLPGSMKKIIYQREKFHSFGTVIPNQFPKKIR
jgi:hypothetical protein